MAYETDAQRLKDDLKDPLFTCYVYVGDVGDDGWKWAKFALGFIPELNIYIFRDHALLKDLLGTKKPRGIAFGWKDKIKKTLNASEAGDLGIVMRTIAEAKKR